ncbi:hypothetical protein [Psychromarinibacter sp. S121]|uniref:hypothetical protein n=1 Tax=Psychromarinibacter sp. S121 TaxID=3415127 RepID=UPI003C7CE28A
MRPIRRLRIGLSAACIAMAVSQAAAGDLGRITAFLDGDPIVWHTITMQQGGRTVATASVTQGARLTEVYVQGHPEPAFGTAKLFTLEARYVGPYAAGVLPLSVDIMYMPDGMGGPFWTSRGATRAPSLDIVALDVWGNFGRLEAVFEGELCLRRIISSATDPATCRTVSGLIETEIFAE